MPSLSILRRQTRPHADQPTAQPADTPPAEPSASATGDATPPRTLEEIKHDLARLEAEFQRIQGEGPRPPNEVLDYVARILAKAREQPDEHNAAAKTKMLFGAILCIVGLLVTVGTFAMAAPGGVYIVAFGAILGGAAQFIRGAIDR